MGIDVIVAGGGPTGLMLAGELALRGVRVVVLERSARPSTAARANGLAGQVVRLMDQRGLYSGLSRAGRSRLSLAARLGLWAQRSRPAPVRRYQYGGFDLDLRHDPFHVLPVAQWQLESVVEGWGRRLGVELRRGHEVTGLGADDDGVDVAVRGPDGAYRLRAAYLVGCDGAHSQIRKWTGIEFAGVTATDLVSRNAHVRGLRTSVSGSLVVPGHGALRPYQFHRTLSGAFSFAPFPGGVHLVNTYEWGGLAPIEDEPLSYEDLGASLRRVLGTDLGVRPPEGLADPVRRHTSTRNTRMAVDYRRGRVFIAGDAAHVFTGFGGPGLNLGLSDVVNLGWKLAAAVTGHAPPGLLDTYATERQPQAAQVLRQTLQQTALLEPGPAADKRRREFAERIADPAERRRLVDAMAGSEPPYPMPGAEPGPLVGRLARDRRLDGSRLAVRQRNGQALLLDASPDGRPGALAGERVPVVRVPMGPTMLIRPDGYVAWVAPDARTTGLETALDAWTPRRSRGQ